MKTLIKERHRKILELFYLDKSSKVHLREIARKTGLNENSTYISLKNLELEGLLESIMDGNLKKYSLKKNLTTFALLSLFDAEKYTKLLEIRKRAISYYYNQLKEKPIMIILFGSTAKGSFKKESDIDLLLVVNLKIDAKKAEEYAESQTGIKINSLQIKYPDFLEELLTKKDKVVASAINTGYPITNNIKFYEEVLK